jgi:hypothetical protein
MQFKNEKIRSPESLEEYNQVLAQRLAFLPEQEISSRINAVCVRPVNHQISLSKVGELLRQKGIALLRGVISREWSIRLNYALKRSLCDFNVDQLKSFANKTALLRVLQPPLDSVPTYNALAMAEHTSVFLSHWIRRGDDRYF